MMVERSKEEILNLITETVRYYADHNKLGRGEGGNCKYITEEGNMCAVGRCLVDPATIEKAYHMHPINLVLNKCGDSIFKEEYRSFKQSLWEALQLHHDCRVRSVDLSEADIVRIINNLYSSNTCT